MSAFKVLELATIFKGALVARVRLEMSSGLIVAGNVLRSRKDADVLFVLPVGERLQNGSYAAVVDFANAELKTAWQAAALEALKPRMAELVSPPANRTDESGGGGYAPF